MNRRAFVVLGIAAALLGVAVESHAQSVVRAANGAAQAWQAERAFHLTRILERAKVQLNNTLLKIEIGTMAPIDADATRQAVAQIDALIKADSVRTTKPATTGPRIAALRIQLAEALNALDLAEVKFDNGMISTKSMNDAYLAIVTLLLN